MIRASAFARASAVALVFAFAFAPGVAHADETVATCADAAEQGQELRNAHHLVDARARFLVCTQRECPTVIRASCTEWLTALDRRLPSLVVTATDAVGFDIPRVTVLLDGVALPDTVTRIAVRADPGFHVLRYSAEGYDPLEDSVLLREGEPVRILEVKLRRATVQPPTPVAPPPAPAEPAPGPPRAASRPVPVVPFAFAATSLLGVATFAYLGLSGASDYQLLERECKPHCMQSDIDSVRTRFIAADVSLIVGVVAAGVATTLWLLDRRAHASPAPAAQTSAVQASAGQAAQR